MDNHRRTRRPAACDTCRRSKIGCNLERPCRVCLSKHTECITTIDWHQKNPRRRYWPSYPRIEPKLRDSAHEGETEEFTQVGPLLMPRTLSTPGETRASPTTHQEPPSPANSSLSGFDGNSSWEFTPQKSLVLSFPRTKSATSLETYFSAVHCFSLVVYEPKFRSRYNAIASSRSANRSDRGFLILLLMVLIMGCWHTPKTNTEDLGLSLNDIIDMGALQSKLLEVVQRDFMDLMDEDCLEFVQICALLGSFYLYLGRPRSSFFVLGAATKTSQAMNLHRESGTKWSSEDTEERKRVWWTIYTWDRFATITSGRAFGINDIDCNVSSPNDVFENVHFGRRSPPTQICVSTYQRLLNSVYKIASPVLEDILGICTSLDMDLRSQLLEMIEKANQALLEWQQALPPHLSFDHIDDLTPFSTTKEETHGLQALSLQLTYDNLMIVLHRPLLAGRESEWHSTSPEAQFSDSNHSYDMQETSFKRCLGSALRISNLQRKHRLFAIARETHLVSFLGINLFTASVILFIRAMSDSLSDTAQEAKQGLRRALQMQNALSNHATLSMQSSTISEDLVQVILRKEAAEMPGHRSTRHMNTFIDSVFHNGEPHTNREQVGSISSQSEILHPGYPNELATHNSEASSPQGSHFSRSLVTLQSVFHDNRIRRQKGLVGGEQGFMGGNQAINLDHMDFTPSENNLNSGGMIVSQDSGYNSNLSGVEDLGQFWLWNL